jgi:hypothetical protein
MASIYKAGNTAYISLYSEETSIQVTLVMHNVKSNRQLNKALDAWFEAAHPSLTKGLEVSYVSYNLYDVLKAAPVDRVFEIDNQGVDRVLEAEMKDIRQESAKAKAKLKAAQTATA